jgi:hypothetical protein
MEAYVEVGDLKNRDGAVWLNFAKPDVANTNANAALVVAA